MKRVLVLMTGLVVALAGMLVAPAEKSYAAQDFYGPASFTTEDGKWDGNITVDSTYRTVRLTIDQNLMRIYKATDIPKPWSPASLTARLCSASSGNCTSFKTFGSSRTITFTNMLPAKYYIDIRDPWTDSYAVGKISARTEK
ncbi:hypothetical protein [Staphylospora marina]|uniref:hypothetical protein n=1 Tax=Staphylospora marina TaxID=2490858 RepID=UPI000F5C2867|nr:hypothetical protein [Staphylospora marina]